MTSLRVRVGDAADAEAVARLHADSWRRHYRGAYADSFLDGDVIADRLAVWTQRLAAPVPGRTVLAEDDAGLVGFVHIVFDADGRWGSLVDNLHVAHDRRRSGTGSALMACAARAVLEGAATRAMYLRVLAQNSAAQRFYQALGGIRAGLAPVAPPGGVPGRLAGAPQAYRIAWPDVSALAARSGDGAPAVC
ncbi:GNAT family N-acetyltransferase [Catellatospora sp. NPDC049609]|uniref:GNAT family N-acetyltransferase n=1 Tax=Catellatospora sp. NPDC049609 TaxID=3155505 RepID=UPI0034264334